MEVVQQERRARDKKGKMVTFFLVMGLMFVTELGKKIEVVDHVSHAAVVAYMGARVFMRNL